MLPSEFTLAQWVVQTVFAGLFVWLLWDTRKENRARQVRSDEREERLMTMLNQYNQTLSSGLSQIGSLVAQAAYLQETLIRVVERMDTLTQRIIQMDVDIKQMREWAGDRRAKMDTGELRERLEGGHGVGR